MDVLSNLNAEVNHVISGLLSHPVAGTENVYLTQFLIWAFIGLITALIIFMAAKKRASLVPEGRFMNAFEMVVDFIADSIGKTVIGDSYKKHMPFLMTLFVFILVNNLWGLVPGGKSGTGTMGVTVALAIISFVYFVAAGIKSHGVWGYVKSLAPAGIMTPIRIVVWFIELLSTFLRIMTLSIRLFANMFAGHMAMGALAILASLFFAPVIESLTAGALLGGLPSVGFILLLLIMYAVEMIVAFVQAYVFTMLSAVYISLATAEEH